MTPCMPSTPELSEECQGCARLVDHVGSLKGWRTPVVMDATTVRDYFAACPMRVAGEEAREAA
jgi:hypothetical protein